MAYIVVVREYGRDGGVEDAEEAQRGADAIGTVPEGGCGEQVRCEEREVVRVAEGGEQRGRGSEDAGGVSCAVYTVGREGRTAVCLLDRCRPAVRAAASRGGDPPAS